MKSEWFLIPLVAFLIISVVSLLSISNQEFFHLDKLSFSLGLGLVGVIITFILFLKNLDVLEKVPANAVCFDSLRSPSAIAFFVLLMAFMRLSHKKPIEIIQNVEWNHLFVNHNTVSSRTLFTTMRMLEIGTMEMAKFMASSSVKGLRFNSSESDDVRLITIEDWIAHFDSFSGSTSSSS